MAKTTGWPMVYPNPNPRTTATTSVLVSLHAHPIRMAETTMPQPLGGLVYHHVHCRPAAIVRETWAMDGSTWAGVQGCCSHQGKSLSLVPHRPGERRYCCLSMPPPRQLVAGAVGDCHPDVGVRLSLGTGMPNSGPRRPGPGPLRGTKKLPLTCTNLELRKKKI